MLSLQTVLPDTLELLKTQKVRKKMEDNRKTLIFAQYNPKFRSTLV